MRSFISNPRFPCRVICLTEESVETLYLLGLQDVIVGVSAFVRRPPEARRKKIVTSFIKADIGKITELKPDLILGYSDIQKDIAKDLIALGLPVWIANHHSLQEILDYVLQLGSMFGKKREAIKLIEAMSRIVRRIEKQAKKLPRVPRVYFEEWNEPMIHGIGWVTEAIRVAGGRDVIAGESRSLKRLAKERITNVNEVREAKPDIVFCCWCGKTFDSPSITQRLGAQLPAVQTGWVKELPPDVFLQPGPAIFLDGIPRLFQEFSAWNNARS